MRVFSRFIAGVFLFALCGRIALSCSNSDMVRDVVEWLPWLILAGFAGVSLLGNKPILSLVPFAAGIAVIPLTMVVMLVVRPYIDRQAQQRPFDAEIWRAAGENDRGAPDPVRLGMVADLMESSRLRGMSRDGVEAILGVPDAVEKVSKQSVDRLMYVLNPGRSGASVDDEVLFILFDQQGIYRRSWIEIW